MVPNIHPAVLMNTTDDVIVPQLLLMVVKVWVQLLLLKLSILPYLFQRVILHQAAILKNSHQKVLLRFACSSLYRFQETTRVPPQR